MTDQPVHNPITGKEELVAALQLAVGLELSTIPVYLTALYSIEDGHNADAIETIRSVVMEEMLHMVLAANILSALGTRPSTDPVTFKTFKDVPPVPSYPYPIQLIDGIGALEVRPFTPQAVDGFVKIEHPFHGAASLRDITRDGGGYPTIGEFYRAISAALDAHCTDADFGGDRHQVAAGEYYGGAGDVIQVTSLATAKKAIEEIIDQGEGLPPQHLAEPAVVVSTEDRLNSGWTMYSHYARFRELQTGRRFRKDQNAGDEPQGALLLVDYDAVHPAVYLPHDGPNPGGPEGIALHEFDLAYSQLVDDLYLAFAGGKKQVTYTIGRKPVRKEEDALPLAVHGMWALKNRAVALMRTPVPDKPDQRLCPRFRYARTPAEREHLRAEIEQMKRGAK